MRFSNLMFIVLSNLAGAGVLFTACAGPRAIPLPSGGPEALPADVLLQAGRGVRVEDAREVLALEIVGEFYSISQEIGNQLWSGWPWAGMAFGIRTTRDSWLLINHDDAPPGMQVASQEIIPFAVYVGRCPEGIPEEGRIRYRGRSMAVLPLEPRSWFVQEGAKGVSLLLRLFQEAFHLYSTVESTQPGDPDLRPLQESYALSLDTVNNVLGRAEAMALAEAIAGEAPSSSLDAAACFLELRRIRRARMDPRLEELERQWESRPGLALYTGSKAVELACAAIREGWDVRSALDGTVFIDYEAVAGDLEEQRRTMLALVEATGYLAGRTAFTITGMVQALLLDRLAPGWRTAYIDRGAPPLEVLLKEVLGD